LWQFIVNSFSQLIQFSYHLTDLAGVANYGLAIILMTVLIKVILYPLTNSQLKSMRTMQELQPKLKELQAKYKDSPEKIQAETMKLYQEKGFNPLGGCLPLLVQMPILIAFYSALLKFKYTVPAHASFLWIPNLSQTDPWYLLPVLAAVTTYYQQRISTVDASDPTQRTMMMVMPLFIGWMATKFAAGLALYWVMFNILSILQQLYVNYKNKPAAAVEGVGMRQVAVEVGGRTMPREESNELASDTERNKGGKTDANSGKKRKKR